jgi:hypothetical protein
METHTPEDIMHTADLNRTVNSSSVNPTPIHPTRINPTKEHESHILYSRREREIEDARLEHLKRRLQAMLSPDKENSFEAA